ncbi:hypothetical protein AYM40_36765 (plasmid) [Paraburkholderia phytofirmans OLGA172]|uniref:Uncharacterized protein n=2 Tax=Paraburkholderia phytofirmans TaxID=261302 RepID=A0A167WNU6_9BURK|nr:hypothetical protein AYM40_36765 [Paraburkholderia phytofirmans OLGA172]
MLVMRHSTSKGVYATALMEINSYRERRGSLNLLKLLANDLEISMALVGAHAMQYWRFKPIPRYDRDKSKYPKLQIFTNPGQASYPDDHPLYAIRDPVLARDRAVCLERGRGINR